MNAMFSAQNSLAMCGMMVSLWLSLGVTQLSAQPNAPDPGFTRDLGTVRAQLKAGDEMSALAATKRLHPQDLSSLELVVDFAIEVDVDHPKIASAIWEEVHRVLTSIAQNGSKRNEVLGQLGNRIGVGDGKDTVALFLSGMLFYYSGRPSGASGMLDALGTRFPRASQVVWYRVLCRFLSGNTAGALEILHDEDFADRMGRRMYYLKAEILRDKNREKALESLELASRMSKNPDAKKQVERAKKQIQRCLEMKTPVCPGTWLYSRATSQVSPSDEHLERTFQPKRSDLKPTIVYTRSANH